MKRTHRGRATIVVFSVVAMAGLLVHANARGADHADSPDTSEGNLDINDLYAFTQDDNLVFALTVSPLLTPGTATEGAYFNPNGLYQIKLDRERDGIEDAVIQIVVEGTGSDQTIDVRGPVAPSNTGTQDNAIANGPSARGAFNTSFSGAGLNVFAGPRDDPFFIDLFGDKSVTSVLNAAFSAALGEQVGDPSEQSLEFNPDATDDLAGLNVLAIVIELPKASIADALGIEVTDSFFAWATTSVRN